MDRTYNYTIKIEADEDGGYDVVVPALPGCSTWGETYEAALAMAREAIEGYLEALVRLGKPLPVEPQTLEGGFLVLGVTPHLTA
jgi:antitoxin HicB